VSLDSHFAIRTLVDNVLKIRRKHVAVGLCADVDLVCGHCLVEEARSESVSWRGAASEEAEELAEGVWRREREQGSATSTPHSGDMHADETHVALPPSGVFSAFFKGFGNAYEVMMIR
jgi:hypothetical protein